MEYVYSLKNMKLTLSVEGRGFSLWVKEDDGLSHWLIDASLIKEDEIIRLDDNYGGYKTRLIEIEKNIKKVIKIGLCNTCKYMNNRKYCKRGILTSESKMKCKYYD